MRRSRGRLRCLLLAPRKRALERLHGGIYCQARRPRSQWGLQFLGCRLLLGGRAAQRYTKLALRLEPVQEAVASVSLERPARAVPPEADVPPATSRPCRSTPPLRAHRNFTKCLRDGRRIPRRGQNRRIRTPARCAVPDLRNTRIRNEGQWSRSGLKFAPALLSGPHARPDVHWSPAEVSTREAGALETARKRLMTPTEEGTPQAKSANLSDDDHDDNLRKADSCRGETCRPSRAADREARAQRPKTARQTEIGSRFAWWWPSSSLRSCTTLPAKSEWVANVCCIDLLFFQGNRVHKILSAKRSP